MVMFYLQEPFILQENLTKTNFSFRDYYKGAIESNDIFMGDVIVSASSGLPICSNCNPHLF